MRTNLFGAVLAAAVSVAVGACSKPGADIVSVNPKDVDIELACLDNGGVSFKLTPWRAEIPKNGSIKWKLTKAEKVKEAEIKPAKADRWPFVDPSFKTELNKPAEAKYKTDATPGVYKYTVSATCLDTNNPRTVIIDPDMIIPN